MDLSGKLLTAGLDQENQRARYLMVACYTFPVTADGLPLIQPPGHAREDQDQPLPSMESHGGGDLSSGSRDQAQPSMDLHGEHGPN